MIKAFLQDETGLELSEYAVAAALVVVVAAGVFAALGDVITLKMGELSGHIKTGK
jgi:Flp pilus assembly pilin Flp